MRRSPSLAYLPSSALSKGALLVWLMVALYLWHWMGREDINLLVNTIVGGAVMYSFIRSIQRGAFLRFSLEDDAGALLLRLRDKKTRGARLALLLFAFGFTTSLFVSAAISGDWITPKTLASSCIGDFHIHHWQWSTLAVIFLLKIFQHYGDTLIYRRYSAVAIVFAVVCVIAVGLLFLRHGWFPPESGLWRSFGALAVYSLYLGVLLRRREAQGRWFFVLMCLNLGVALGIAVEGFIFADLPESLIYINSDGCGYPLSLPADLLSS